MRTLLQFVACDATVSICNEGLTDNDFLFAEKPRSTENMYMVVQQFTDCDSIDSSCNGGFLMDNDLLSSRNLDLHRIRSLPCSKPYADTTDSGFN